ncbi:hypothetical protein AMELA_G00128200 [Ameiurus melas]|uniref:Uncharacterized protein n=1 Tax=Ameiurus melas TaxID=219545 RepID=A0A7J6ANF2_AMEME|nr:hypothetical protein AMELA_G00128200 [Ameiurus melas]
MDDSHVHQITDENKLLFKKEKHTVLESNMCLSKCVLKQGSKRPSVPWRKQGASCSTPGIISGSGAKHEADKNILDSPTGHLSPLFKGSPEKPDFSAEPKKDDDDRGVRIDITGDGSAPERTDENELLLKQKKDTVREKANVLTNLKAKVFFKSNRAGCFSRTCPSDSLFETAGTEVNTVNSIPCHSEPIYTFAEESTKKPDFSAESKKGDDAGVIPISVMDDSHVHQITDENKLLFKKEKHTVLESYMCLSKCVLKQGSKRPSVPWRKQGASCSTPGIISGSGAKHEADKNILDSPTGHLSPLFKGSPEKPDFSAEPKKDDDDRGVRIDITGDDSAPERTDENELLLKQKKDTVREKANVLTNLKAKVFFKSNRAGCFGSISPSDSLFETAGTEVNTVNSIPRYSKNNTISESKCVLKPRPQHPHLSWPKQGASCSTAEVISGSGAEHEAEKKILDRPAEKDNVRRTADSLCETAGTISHGGSTDPAPVSVEEEERRWFDIIPEENPPINCCGFKKENNGCADILKVSGSSTEEDLHKSKSLK